MTRWEPDSRGKLSRAALALFDEQGFENTTVAEIASQAGLTERTFFRHFADKREVLFAGGAELQARMTAAVAAAPAALPPLGAIAVGLDAAAAMLEERREFSSQRQRIVAASPELRERELIKLASLSAALAEALRGRGVEEPAASLAAEVGIAVFRIGIERWNDGDAKADLSRLLRDSLDQLQAVAGGS